MATECQLDCSDEDSKMLDEAEERGVLDWSPETYAEVMPEVERAIAERCVECLEENVENAKNELTEKLAQEEREPTDLERLDLELKPTQKEYQENYMIAKEVGMEDWETVSTPVIVAIKDPDTLERLDNQREIIKDEMTNLRNSKLSPIFRDTEVVDRIVFIDKDEPSKRKGMGRAGVVLGKGNLVSKPELSRTAHIFRDPDAGKLPKGKEAHQVVIHEICHLNMFKEKIGEASDFAKIFTDDHRDEWLKTCNAQLEGPWVVSRYAGEQLPEEGPREFGFLNPEFVAEHVSYWDADLGVEICPEMREFFDKYLT